ncbi:hypothetical protein BDR03DRAFT_1018849 [Suillus americanus]|nr:hypothetical protein BDR03DRAFT_1018849 [Suillus americanus]
MQADISLALICFSHDLAHLLSHNLQADISSAFISFPVTCRLIYHQRSFAFSAHLLSRNLQADMSLALICFSRDLVHLLSRDLQADTSLVSICFSHDLQADTSLMLF